MPYFNVVPAKKGECRMVYGLAAALVLLAVALIYNLRHSLVKRLVETGDIKSLQIENHVLKPLPPTKC
jgi:hypothetical protein